MLLKTHRKFLRLMETLCHAINTWKHSRHPKNIDLGWIQDVGHLYTKLKCEVFTKRTLPLKASRLASDLFQENMSFFRYTGTLTYTEKTVVHSNKKWWLSEKQKFLLWYWTVLVSAALHNAILSLYDPWDFFYTFWRKATVWALSDIRLYFFQDIYILACECN